MAAYNPRTDLLTPSVQLDTDSFARGIAAAGGSFANALREYGQDKREDKQRAEARAWQVADQEQQWEHQLRNYGMRRADEVADRQQTRGWQVEDRDFEKEMQKQMEADSAAGINAAVMAAYPGIVTPDMVHIADGMSPKAQHEFAKALAGYGVQKSREDARNTPPEPWAVEVPGQPGKSIYGVGRSPMGTTGGAAAGLQVQTAPTGEQIWTYGGKPVDPKSVYIKGDGGLKPLVPPKPVTPPRPRLSPGTDAKGNPTVTDLDTRLSYPVTPAPPAAPAAPSKTAGSFFQ